MDADYTQDSDFGHNCHFHMVIDENSDEIMYNMTSIPMFEEDGAIPIYSTNSHDHDYDNSFSELSHTDSSHGSDNGDHDNDSHYFTTNANENPDQALYNTNPTSVAHGSSDGYDSSTQVPEHAHYYQADYQPAHPLSSVDPEFISPPITPQASTAPAQLQPIMPLVPPQPMFVNQQQLPSHLTMQNVQMLGHLYALSSSMAGQTQYYDQPFFSQPGAPPVAPFVQNQGQNSISVPTYFLNSIAASHHLSLGGIHAAAFPYLQQNAMVTPISNGGGFPFSPPLPPQQQQQQLPAHYTPEEFAGLYMLNEAPPQYWTPSPSPGGSWLQNAGVISIWGDSETEAVIGMDGSTGSAVISFNPLSNPSVLTTHPQALLGPENPDFITFLRMWNFAPRHVRDASIMKMLEDTAHHKKIEFKDLQGPACDIQGINWDTLGVKRKDARVKREMYYKNYTNCGRTSEMATGYDDTRIRRSEVFYQFRVNHMRKNVHLSHFQLRNMLATPSLGRIFYPDKSGIREFNSFDGTDELILNTGPITEEALSTMTADHGMLVAGTFSGKYHLRRLDSETKGFTDGHITTDDSGITNHVQVYMPRTSSNPVAGFCSNDLVFRVMDLVTEKFTSSFKYSCAINCSAISPDGRLRVIVGDSKSVLITNTDTGEILQRLDGHRDFGFACDWAGDGWTVATGFQDMGIKIWDARRWRDINGNATPVTTIRSELSGVRSLRFTPVGSGLRALVAAEEADFVNIIDGRNFQSKQTFDVFGEIGGISFADDANELNILCSDTYKGGIIQLDRCRYGVESTRWKPVAPMEELFNEEVMQSTPMWLKQRPMAMRPCTGSDWDDLADTQVKQMLRGRGLLPRSQRPHRAVESVFKLDPF